MKKEKMLFLLMKKGIIRKVSEDDYEFVNQVYSLDKGKALDQFKKDAVIPHRLKMNGGFFMASKSSVKAIKKFQELLFDGEHCYEDMVRVTKAFYCNEKMARMGLTSFLVDGVLEGLLEEDKSGTSLDMNKTNKVQL